MPLAASRLDALHRDIALVVHVHRVGSKRLGFAFRGEGRAQSSVFTFTFTHRDYCTHSPRRSFNRSDNVYWSNVPASTCSCSLRATVTAGLFSSSSVAHRWQNLSFVLQCVTREVTRALHRGQVLKWRNFSRRLIVPSPRVPPAPRRQIKSRHRCRGPLRASNMGFALYLPTQSRPQREILGPPRLAIIECPSLSVLFGRR